jgi:hypothetical protein
MSATRTVTAWPGVAALRGEFAEQAWRTAQKRQEDTGWTIEETVRQVQAAATDAAERIALALVQAAEMGLDVWGATR